MIFKYKGIDDKGVTREGEIDALNKDIAISSLQKRGLIVLDLKNQKSASSFIPVSWTERISTKEVVILSRQISTLFEAQVSALKAFNILAANTENKALSRKLTEIGDDLQAGVSISGALARHPDVFSNFYVNMVKVGEETGKLNETFDHLALYLNRQYALTSKTKNALIYPFFVVGTFIIVMGLMFTVVIPKLGSIIKDSGQEPPVFTKVVLGMSDFFVNYGFLFLIFLVALGIWFWKFSTTEKGKVYMDKIRLTIPVIGALYRKLYLSRIADNMDTTLSAGIPIVRALDVTRDVVDNRIYKDILKDVADGVKSGLAFSVAFDRHKDFVPSIMAQMIKVGEETGALGKILNTLADFYKKEVDDAVDTLVGLIEPVMIVVLGLGVGILLVSVLMPIYNMTGAVG